MKKIILSIVIIGIILILIGGGLFAYFKLAKGGVGRIESTSDDGFAKLSATFYDFSGKQITGGVTQALIGGISKQTHVKFDLSATNTGDVDLENVQTASPNSNMDGAFSNINILPALAVGQSNILVGTTAQDCTATLECDTNEECCETGVGCGDVNGQCYIALDQYASGTAQHNVDFSISLQGGYYDAIGNLQTITSDPVILTYDIREETCTDGTTINTCVFDRTGLEEDKPKYCKFTEGSAPSIINKASVCGCPTGYHADGENCALNTCSDGTAVGSCSTSSHEGTYGAYYYCKSDQTFEARCNQCSATLDYYGNPHTGCSSATDPSSAVYQDYTGGLSGELTE